MGVPISKPVRAILRYGFLALLETLALSTRAVDALAEALGLKGISKDQVSRICKELDAQVHAFRTRPLDAEYPYLMLDATFEKVRENGRVISMAVLIATGVKRTGEREVLGAE